MQKLRQWKYIAVLLLFLGIFSGIKGIVIRPRGAKRVDFWKHYTAVERVLDGKSPYTGKDLYLSFNYPQFVAWYTLPLGFFTNIQDAGTAWDIFSICLVLLSAGIAMFACKPPDHGESEYLIPWWITAFFISFFFGPNTSGLRPGNLSSSVLFSMMLLCWTVIRKKEYAIGVMIAIASLVKVLPVFLIIPYIISRQKKPILGATAVYALYFVALLITGTLKNEWFYVTKVLPHVSFYWRGVSHSIPCAMMRHFWKGAYDSPPILSLANIVWGLIVFIPYVALCWFRRELMNTKRGALLLFACGALMLPLLTPLLEYLHFIWAFPGIVVALYSLYRGWIPVKYLPWLIFAFVGLSLSGLFAENIATGNFSLYNLAPCFDFILYISFISLVLHTDLPRTE